MHCSFCLQEKSLDDFYVSNKTKCKECLKKSVKENRLKNIDYYKEFDRNRAMRPDRIAMRAAYQKTEAGRAAYNRAHKASKERFPERKKAADAVSNALRDGRLFKLPCFVCGKEEVEGHHPDYSRPLDVVWLCVKHHRETHKMVNSTFSRRVRD